jgi:hypothetical protein
MTATPSRPADPAEQQRRLHFVVALAGARLRLAVVPEQAVRRRQRVQSCSAARILTALGVRVLVVQPDRPWPRDRPLRLVTTERGWLADLAVLTAVPRTTPGWALLADRVFRPSGGTPVPGQPDALSCRVAVRFRSDDGDLSVTPRTAAGIAAVRGLVVEVRLLAAEERASARHAA